MTYKIYTTDAFVVKTRQSKDADLSVLIFTEELGLLNAIAKSARAQKTKLGFALQTMSFSRISLVKGKEVWRVTSVKKHISLYDNRLHIELRTLFARMLLFIERFCPREQVEDEVFSLLKQIAGFVFKEVSNDPFVLTYIPSIEHYFTLNVLYYLGYVKNEESEQETIGAYIDKKITQEMALKLLEPDLLHKIQKVIDKGMTESHL
jgi:hypothetical protein